MTPLELRRRWKNIYAIVTVIVAAIIAVVFGTLGDELFHLPTARANGSLQRAEKDFRDGKDRTAIALFEILAKKNDAVAQYWLAHMTELGLGVPRDPAKAIALYKQAADRDMVPAELRLGQIYLHGNLVPPDFKQAKSYLEKAAYHGNARAAMLLGDMYGRGLGTPVNSTQSYAWSEVATLEGSRAAKRERNLSLRNIGTKDQQSAISRASEIFNKIKLDTAAPNSPKLSVEG